MKRNVFISTILSLSLLTNISVASCSGGNCFVNFSSSDKKEATIKVVEKKLFLVKNKMIVEDSFVLDNQIETIAFSPETYIMTAEEKSEYEAEENLLMLPLEKIEDLIMNNHELPTSDHFCENDMKPIYNNVSDTYECA